MKQEGETDTQSFDGVKKAAFQGTQRKGVRVQKGKEGEGWRKGGHRSGQ